LPVITEFRKGKKERERKENLGSLETIARQQWKNLAWQIVISGNWWSNSTQINLITADRVNFDIVNNVRATPVSVKE
jgi:hypothetical protein